MNETRYINPAETLLVKQLWGAAFGTEEPYFSWYFQDVYRPERTLAAFSDGEMTACLQFAPYTMRLHNELLPVSYLVGVTTAEAWRGRGIGHALLRTALDELSHTACRLALLYTDIPAYYEPMGFIHAYRLRRLGFSSLKDKNSTLSADWHRSNGEKETALLSAIYQHMCARCDGYIQRTPANWRSFCRDLLTDKSAELWISEHSYIMAYTDSGRFILREVGFDDEKSLAPTLTFARQLAFQRGFDHVQWDAPANLPLPRQPRESSRPYVMARALHIGPDCDAAAETRRIMGIPSTRLWIGEIT